MRGLGGLLDRELPSVAAADRDGVLVVGTRASSPLIAALDLAADLRRAGDEGFVIRSLRVAGRPATVVAANTDVGVLYGAFRLLRLVQTNQPPSGLALVDAPRVRHRLLDHWDNLDRTVERGYAGLSLWDWHKLPDYLSPRYTDYARANASIGDQRQRCSRTSTRTRRASRPSTSRRWPRSPACSGPTASAST